MDVSNTPNFPLVGCGFANAIRGNQGSTESCPTELMKQVKLIVALHCRDPVSLTALASAIQHGDVEARREALTVCEQFGPDAAPAVPDLIQALQDPDSEVRYLAARTLFEVGSAARPALGALERATNDPRDIVRNRAAKAINRIQTNSPATDD